MEDVGEGIPVVLLHGLTATHRYVVMGSRALERSAHRVIAYDARGHGASAPAADPEAYRYEDLADDLLRVLDERGIDRAVLAGASMGGHTALRVALERPERVAGLVVITPAYEPGTHLDADSLARWDALSAGLREGGVEGFVAAYGEPDGGPGVARHAAHGAAPAARRTRASGRGGGRAARRSAVDTVRPRRAARGDQRADRRRRGP